MKKLWPQLSMSKLFPWNESRWIPSVYVFLLRVSAIFLFQIFSNMSCALFPHLSLTIICACGSGTKRNLIHHLLKLLPACIISATLDMGLQFIFDRERIAPHVLMAQALQLCSDLRDVYPDMYAALTGITTSALRTKPIVVERGTTLLLYSNHAQKGFSCQ